MAKKKFNKIFEKVVTKFSCPTCGTEHDTRPKAVSCCPLEIETSFECGACGTVHDTTKEARECCMEFECEECGEIFDTLKEANKHVCDEDGD